MRGALILLLLSIGCRATPSEPAPAPPKKASRVDGSRVVTLEATTKPQTMVVVVMHGLGADARDLLGIAERWRQALPRAAFLLPDGLDPHGSGRRWFAFGTEQERIRGVREAGGEVSKWIDGVLEQRGLPADAVVVSGFSQGAMLAMWLGVHRPTRAVVAFSGRYVDEDPKARAAGVPMLLTHGGADAIISFTRAESSRALLAARGAAVETLFEPAVGHTITNAALERSVAFLQANAR